MNPTIEQIADRRRPAFLALVAVAFAVSVVHYADNYFNYDDFPQPDSGPAPSAGLVGASWFMFTAAAVGAVLAFRRAELLVAGVLLLFYSGSGLVGFGHYTVDGAFEMPWWRQAHVVIDILCGLALAAFAVLLLRETRSAAR